MWNRHLWNRHWFPHGIVLQLRTLTALGALAPALCLFNLRGGTRIYVPAQASVERQVDVGDILLANERLGDPNFAESVVLIVQFEQDKGTMGVILNRRTKVPISKVFPATAGATSDPVFLGGPVQVTAVQALLRLPEKTSQARHIIGNVYATGSKELIEKSIASRSDPSKFRLYLGYAGWGPGQLEAEIQIGAWSLVTGRPEIAFDRDPESLWQRLTKEQQMQIAAIVPALHGVGHRVS
jgi:putative transcriptional regulator